MVLSSYVLFLNGGAPVDEFAGRAVNGTPRVYLRHSLFYKHFDITEAEKSRMNQKLVQDSL